MFAPTDRNGRLQAKSNNVKNESRNFGNKSMGISPNKQTNTVVITPKQEASPKKK
jgi:hypothetical protein